MQKETKALKDAERDNGEGNEDDEERDGDSMDDEPSRMDLFGKCFTKNGETSNPIVAETWQKMQEKKSELPPNSKDDGPNDIFSQVNGEDKGGRVRMYGYGVTISDIYGDIPSRGKSSRMRMSYKKDINELKQIVLEQNKQIQELMKINMQRATRDSPPEATRVPSSSSSQYHVASFRPSTSSSMHKMPLQVGAKVSLKSVFDSSKTVAIGCLQSLDPSKRVGQVQLGENWCEIIINVAVENDEDLIRPTLHFKTIGDAIGEVIAWPKNLVAMD